MTKSNGWPANVQSLSCKKAVITILKAIVFSVCVFSFFAVTTINHPCRLPWGVQNIVVDGTVWLQYTEKAQVLHQQPLVSEVQHWQTSGEGVFQTAGPIKKINNQVSWPWRASSIQRIQNSQIYTVAWSKILFSHFCWYLWTWFWVSVSSIM